jgi:ABC-type Fe3+-siderophore transport system permease subunit
MEAEIIQQLETIRITLAIAIGVLLAIFGLLAIKL